MKSFSTSQFSFSLLNWRLSYNSNDNRINYYVTDVFHSDQIASYVQLLKNYESALMDIKDPQLVATKMFKYMQRLSPGITIAIFVRRVKNHHKLCYFTNF